MSYDPAFWPELNRKVRYALSDVETDRAAIEVQVGQAIKVKLWERLGHPSFDAWVEAGFEDSPPGLGMSPDALLKIAHALCPALLDAIDRARQRAPGNPRIGDQVRKPDGTVGGGRTLDNVKNSDVPTYPTGNSAAAALRRLRKDGGDKGKPPEVREKAKELHRRVVGGEISAHAAAVEMGYRRRPSSRDTILREFGKLERPAQIEVLHDLADIVLADGARAAGGEPVDADAVLESLGLGGRA